MAEVQAGESGSALESRGQKSGRVIFVPLTLPGDVVTVKITEEERRFATAELLEIETPSPDRVEARCAVFGRCGGCSWQHVPYELQWKTKKNGVLHALSRVGIECEESLHEFPADQSWNYRNRIQLRARLAPGNSAAELGYFGRRSRSLVDIERCEIADERLNASLGETRKEAAQALISRFEAGEAAPGVKVELEVLPDGSVRSAWNSRHGAMGFRQVNDEQNDKLKAFARAHLSEGAHVLDLFGGAGNFSLEDAARYAWVECVDTGSPEGGFAGQPANYRFFRSDVSRWLARREADFAKGFFKPKGPLQAVLDPPREGLGERSKKIAGSLDALGVERLIAVGCDVDSWARDLARLTRHGWKLRQAAVFDLFPQTPHAEAVAVLEKG